MFQAINTKLLIAILAALGAITALLVHERNASERAASDAAKTRAILQLQEMERRAEADAHKREEDAVARKAEEEKKKNNSNYRAKSKTWRTYVP
jgi:Ni/Co efflux regulator RcnB